MKKGIKRILGKCSFCRLLSAYYVLGAEKHKKSMRGLKLESVDVMSKPVSNLIFLDNYILENDEMKLER